ncbi:ligase-associated DNA damage response endonuclease PdeM [Acidiphilium sp. AL]|uniref:Ligase-associated DNA damage response endonuclease PdeM n=1 Tax=Acidiphilium iwatense TaxID=768198 RepID=A0ABS9DWV7_9PROT|nr:MULTISPECIES: ligase-associated DNA damage response endonuclease PdeM [Acidiphilium]MCF3945942.1 ligase-associated DNA damage response endonuclease PdeM [Acidiphilium iwatense]MCU4159177.1 ligase-associated DNA damage response endonuclease PdeM [Acidiphilium sp. AL]
MIAAPIHRASERFLLDPSGAVVWPASRTIIVADLHLEKASSLATRGSLLPPYDSRTTLDRLTLLLSRYAPERVIALGDSFHDPLGLARMAPDDAGRLARLESEQKFIWIAGNHDPAESAMIELREKNFTFRHEASRLAPGEIEFSGHFHPKARIATRGAAIARPCFVADAHRILLPAFGAYAGGLDVTSPPIRALFPRGGQVFLLSRDRIYTFPLAHAAKAS